MTEGSGGRPIRFAVRSLGWVEIAEEDLTPERSSKAVNRCIVDLSVGRRDVLDVVGCWGDVSMPFFPAVQSPSSSLFFPFIPRVLSIIFPSFLLSQARVQLASFFSPVVTYFCLNGFAVYKSFTCVPFALISFLVSSRACFGVLHFTRFF